MALPSSTAPPLVRAEYLYSRFFDQGVNDGLRHNRLSPYCLHITKLLVQGVQQSTPLVQPATFYRGILANFRLTPYNWKVGDVIQGRGFESMSRSLEVVKSFSSGPSNYILHFTFPAGSQVYDISPWSYFQGEEEVISYPNLRYQVETIEHRTIYCRILDYDRSPVGVDPLADEKWNDLYPTLMLQLQTGVVHSNAKIFTWEEYQTSFTTQINPNYYTGVEGGPTPTDTTYNLYNLFVSHGLEKATWDRAPSTLPSYQVQPSTTIPNLNKIQEIALSLNQDPIQYVTLY